MAEERVKDPNELTYGELDALTEQHRDAEQLFKDTKFTDPMTKRRHQYPADEQSAMALWAIAENLKIIAMCLRRAYPPTEEEERASDQKAGLLISRKKEPA
jgi:hypothetical protein